MQRRLDSAVAEHDKAEASARQALLLADRESRSADQVRASGLLSAAETFADRAITLEHELKDIEHQLLDATRASQSAKAAVVANADALRKQLTDRERLIATLDQAKLQERVNSAMAQIDGTLAETVPTFAEVRGKIDARYDRARGHAELAAAQTPTIDLQMLEVERAQRNLSAQARLAEMRLDLGLPQPTEVVRLGPGRDDR